MSTLGPAYDSEIDGERLRKQHEAIRQLMIDGQWRTLQEIAEFLGYPESSVSAQLRHLRKEKFGSYIVEKKRRGTTGLWEYRVEDPRQRFDDVGQGLFFPTPAHR
jgi:DNA-binding Lrp family transcriptional regulator